MAEYTNFDLKKFLAENKQAKNTKALNENQYDTVKQMINHDGFEQVELSDVNSTDKHLKYGEKKAVIMQGANNQKTGVTVVVSNDKDGIQLLQSIKDQLKIEEPIGNFKGSSQKILMIPGSEETVDELDGAGSVDALTALIGAGGLAGGAVALSKLVDSLEDGKLGEKGKAVAKFLRDAGKTFSGQGASMKEETTVELTKEEAFKKEIKDLLDS